MIQPVMVVPTLAPNSTHKAGPSASRPALTKPMAATVTAPDDCTIAVTSMPEPSACQRVRVAPARMRASAGPAASFKPSVIIVMPNRNRPKPPIKLVESAHKFNEGSMAGGGVYRVAERST